MLDRRTFIVSAVSLPAAVSLPLPAVAAPLTYQGVPFIPDFFPITNSVAWGATADEILAELLAQR